MCSANNASKSATPTGAAKGGPVVADDSAYYRRRAIEEQVRAQLSTCAAARERHDELAAIYRFRAAMLSTHPQYCNSPPQEESPQAALLQ